jgi:hypothetical protein
MTAQDENVTPLREPTALEYQLTVDMWQRKCAELEHKNQLAENRIALLEDEKKRSTADLYRSHDQLLEMQAKVLSLQSALVSIRAAVIQTI